MTFVVKRGIIKLQQNYHYSIFKTIKNYIFMKTKFFMLIAFTVFATTSFAQIYRTSESVYYAESIGNNYYAVRKDGYNYSRKAYLPPLNKAWKSYGQYEIKFACPIPTNRGYMIWYLELYADESRGFEGGSFYIADDKLAYPHPMLWVFENSICINDEGQYRHQNYYLNRNVKIRANFYFNTRF